MLVEIIQHIRRLEYTLKVGHLCHTDLKNMLHKRDKHKSESVPPAKHGLFASKGGQGEVVHVEPPLGLPPL